MKKIVLVLALIAAVICLTSCGDVVTADASYVEDSRYTVSWETWDGLDYFNSSVWNRADWTNGGMFNCGWKPDHISFSGGQMTIKLDNQYSHGKPYTSGEYRTNNTFTYGNFETNMIAAKGNGLVTSFFLYTGSPWDEIDVEILGKDTTKVQFNYYVDGQGGNEKLINLGFDASYGFHRYKIEWGPGWINWYVDGNWKYGVNNTGFNAPYGKKMPSHPMQIMANLWPGQGVDSWLNRFSYSGPKYAKYDYFLYKPL